VNVIFIRTTNSRVLVNLDKVSYKLGSLRESLPDLLALIGSIDCSIQFIKYTSVIGANGFSAIPYVGYSIIGIGCIRETLSSLKYRMMHFGIKNNFIEGVNLASERIIIDDLEGLDFLLARTEKNEIREWGSVLKGGIEKTNFVITHITRKEETDMLKIFTRRTPISMNVDFKKLEDWQGTHHYHPSIFTKYLGGINFYVTYLDRFVQNANSINLLTFNTKSGPEIIGFNYLDVYIPESKANRSVLVRADKRQIYDYLS